MILAEKSGNFFKITLGRPQAVPVQRQLANPNAGGVVDRIGECRRDADSAGFANAAGRLGAVDDRHVDRRCLIHAQRSVVIEIALLDAAVAQRDLAEQRGGKAEYDAALDLRLDGIWIHHRAAVHRADDTIDPDLAIVGDRYVGNLRKIAAEGVLHRYAASLALRAPAFPVGVLRRKLEHRRGARRMPQQVETVFDRVLQGSGGKLVDEAFDHKNVVGRADTAPPAGHEARRLATHIVHQYVGDGVEE